MGNINVEIKPKSFTKDDTLEDEIQAYVKKLKEDNPNATVKYKKLKKTTSTTASPISEFGTKDAFVFLVKNEQYYLRFGALLDFLVDKIVPIINSKPKQVPIFGIDVEQYYNWMYSVPNQISLDPRVCIVRNSNFIGSGGAEVDIYHQLLPFRAQDYVSNSPNLNKAYIMNIYLNFNFILDSLNSNADERGNVNLYNFIVSLCDGVSKALGGVNNLEPIVDETSNILKIVDTTPIPGVTQASPSAYTLQLYGYDGVGAGKSRSNFIRKVDLKTAITPEYATMITVGATAGGYVKGTEATAFSRWNAGLTDRFKEEILPSNPTSQKSNSGGVDEAEINYVNKFLDKYNGKHGIKGNLYDGGSISKCELSSDIIDSNISIVTEYYKYQQSQNKEGGGGTVGFIPFKLGLTMDGLAGIKIYNKLHVNTRFLPSNYGKTLDLIVTGVSHELNNNDWETQIEATVIPKTTQSKTSAITAEDIKETIQEVGEISIPIASGTEKEKIISFMNVLINTGGLSKIQAAAIAGNVRAESGFKEWNVEDGKTKRRGSGIGLMQWTGDGTGESGSGRILFEQYVGSWLTGNGVTTPWVSGGVLNTDPKSHNNGASLENNLKSIPKLFEAECYFSIRWINKHKSNVGKNFKGTLSGNSATLVKNGLFKYAEGGKVKKDLGGYTEIFLADGETPATVLAALKKEGKSAYHNQVDHRVASARACLDIYDNK